jgi:hypothetical protein
MWCIVPAHRSIFFHELRNAMRGQCLLESTSKCFTRWAFGKWFDTYPPAHQDDGGGGQKDCGEIRLPDGVNGDGGDGGTAEPHENVSDNYVRTVSAVVSKTDTMIETLVYIVEFSERLLAGSGQHKRFRDENGNMHTFDEAKANVEQCKSILRGAQDALRSICPGANPNGATASSSKTLNLSVRQLDKSEAAARSGLGDLQILLRNLLQSLAPSLGQDIEAKLTELFAGDFEALNIAGYGINTWISILTQVSTKTEVILGELEQLLTNETALSVQRRNARVQRRGWCTWLCGGGRTAVSPRPSETKRRNDTWSKQRARLRHELQSLKDTVNDAMDGSYNFNDGDFRAYSAGGTLCITENRCAVHVKDLRFLVGQMDASLTLSLRSPDDNEGFDPRLLQSTRSRLMEHVSEDMQSLLETMAARAPTWRIYKLKNVRTRTRKTFAAKLSLIEDEYDAPDYVSVGFRAFPQVDDAIKTSSGLLWAVLSQLPDPKEVGLR